MKLLKLNKKKKSQFTVGIFISWRGLIMLEFGDLIRSRSSSFRQIRTTCRHRKKSISGTIHKLRNQKTKNRHITPGVDQLLSTQNVDAWISNNVFHFYRAIVNHFKFTKLRLPPLKQVFSETPEVGNCTPICKVIIEKSRGGRFLWNRNWDLGWIWAGSATFEAGFFMFGQIFF